MKNFTFVGGGKILSGGPKGGRVARFQKNLKILIQNGGFNPQPKFQHSSWIRKCLKIGVFWEGFRPLKGWRGARFQKFEKAVYKTVVRTHTENLSTLALFGCKKNLKTFLCTREVYLHLYTVEISAQSISIEVVLDQPLVELFNQSAFISRMSCSNKLFQP